MAAFFNNRIYRFIWNAEKVINFLDTVNSGKLELNLLKCKLTMLLALTGSRIAQDS